MQISRLYLYNRLLKQRVTASIQICAVMWVLNSIVTCVAGILKSRPAGLMRPFDTFSTAYVYFSNTYCVNPCDER
jgi:hypothetical protein